MAKIVTYEDREAIQTLIRATSPTHPARALLDRLAAHAEADQPPLPEGWVIYMHYSGGTCVYWHRRGVLSRDNDGGDVVGTVDEMGRERLAPLRPTITETDFHNAYERLHTPGVQGRPWSIMLREAFQAAGVLGTSRERGERDG